MNKKYDVEVTFTFKGKFTVKADGVQNAFDLVNQHCGMGSGGDIQSTLNSDEYDFNFPMKPHKYIGDIKEVVEKRMSKEVRKGQVFRSPLGRKQCAARDMSFDDVEVEIITDTPHGDGDFSYLCTSAYCRCQQ